MAITNAPTTLGTTVAPTVPVAPTQEEWWKTPGTTETSPSGLIGATSKWNPTADQTVAGQVDNIIAADSPLMQRAATRADQQMNKRGLMNSSMAVGAGQSAVMDAALPIAQQDAQTNAQAAQFNAGAENTLQGQSNQIRQQAATQNFAATADLAKTDLDNQFKASMVNADAQTKAYLTQLEGGVKANLANIEADYKSLIQTSASAGDIYKGTISQIGPILSDTNMDAAAKSAAINGLMSRMGSAMNLIGSINGVDVTDLLNFGTVTPA
jgi:hypothetical protein